MKIKHIRAREILDSRGTPTVEAVVTLEDGSKGIASTPSGASVGTHEVLELRDEDSRYNGKGVMKAVSNVNGIISEILMGQNVAEQSTIDHLMIETDGTPNKSRLGANAILAVSIACAKAAAISQKIPLWKWLHMSSGTSNAPDYPIPMFNIMNGGAHASNDIAIQEFMVIPQNIENIEDRIEAGVKIDWALKEILKSKGLDVSVGDEGGFAPSKEAALNDDEDVLEFIIQGIEEAGYKPGDEVCIGIDMATSRYYDTATKTYTLPNQRGGSITGSAAAICAYLEELAVKYPFVLIEDGLHEDDWDGWQTLSSTLMAHNIHCVGDDFIVTNTERLEKAIDMTALSSVIVKPNQVGSLTEVYDVIKLCEENMIVPIISHRSGDTADPFVADLAYAVGAKYLKAGAPIRAERLEKYNELLRIRSDLG